MKITRLVTALLLAGPLAWAFAAQADTTTFRGVSVDYGDASASWVDGELVLTYGGDGQLTLGGTVRADILAVGGGGAGGTGKSSTTNARYGNGGNGGEVVETPQVILSSALTIKIGGGGTGSTTSNAKGGDGNDTTVESADGSFVAITAKGGAGGAGNNTSTQAKAGSPTQGVTSEIDGKTYGKGGAKFTNATAQAGDPNTGNGGQGGRAGVPSVSARADRTRGGSRGGRIVRGRLRGDVAVGLEDAADVAVGIQAD